MVWGVSNVFDGGRSASQLNELRKKTATGQVGSAVGRGIADTSKNLEKLGLVAYGGNPFGGSSAGGSGAQDVLAESTALQLAQLSPFQRAGLSQLPNLQQYSQAGGDALQQQMALLGLSGGKAMEKAYQQNPAQAFAQKQMEQQLLRNSAATGGLRGSGVQRELAELTSGLTNQNIQQQIAQLGQLSGQGLGVSQNLYGTGYDAAMGVAGVHGQEAADRLGISAAEREEDARRRSGRGSAVGTAIGYGVGGPVGGMIGGALGGAF